MDKKVKALPDLAPEDFYNHNNSVYLRLTYIPENEGYKVMIFNAMDVGNLNENQIKLAILARGLSEMALEYPTEVFQAGYEASMRDSIDLSPNLSDDEKELMKNPIGSA